MSKTVSEVGKYIGMCFLDPETGELRNGDYPINDKILRFKNGYLDGGDDPAYSTKSFHHEFLKEGKLHRNNGEPAVVHLSDDKVFEDVKVIKEFWVNGEYQSTKVEIIDEKHEFFAKIMNEISTDSE